MRCALRNLGTALATRLGAAGGLSLFFGCLFAGYGVAMAYLNPWMASRGVTVEQLATIASTAALVRMVAGPLVGFLADRSAAHRTVLITMTWLWVGTWLILQQAHVFWQFLAAQVLIALTGAALMPLGDTLTLAGMRAGLMDYGRVRLWGSITFLVATLLGGQLVARFGLEVVIVYLCVAAVATGLAVLLVPRMPVAPSSDGKGPRLSAVLALLSTPLFARFLLAAGLAQASHAMLYVYATLHWQSLGVSAAWCGVLWALGVAAEIVLFWFGPQVLRFAGPMQLLALGLAAGVMRWGLMGFDPPFALLLPLQVMHAATYAAAHLGAMQFLSRAVPPAYAGSAQSAYALASGGLGMAFATQAAGIAYLAGGGRAYWAMAALSAIGLMVCLDLVRRWDGGLVNVAGSPVSGQE